MFFFFLFLNFSPALVLFALYCEMMVKLPDCARSGMDIFARRANF